jgi:hypothetical protein
MSNKEFQHRMEYGTALAKIGKYLGYEPVYELDCKIVKLTDLDYLMNVEVVLEFDIENGCNKVDYSISITFPDRKKLTPLPF